MNGNQMKENLYNLICSYFKQATVLWAEQSNTAVPAPFITIKVHSINRSIHHERNRDSLSKNYHCKAMVDINLFTKGKAISTDNSMTNVYMNTATSDLMEFCNYLSSEGGLFMQGKLGLSILVSSPVRDVSMLENNSGFDYRAMIEVEVNYIEEVKGWFNVSDEFLPTASGGGSKDMANTAIEEVKEIIFVKKEKI